MFAIRWVDNICDQLGWWNYRHPPTGGDWLTITLAIIVFLWLVSLSLPREDKK